MTDVNDIARVMREAFHVATTGRPGPVLVDIPKNVQNMQTVPDYDAPMQLPGYRPSQQRATPEEIATVAELMQAAKRPVIYAGGGVVIAEAAEELTALAHKTAHPRDDHVDRLGLFSGRRSAVARHARNARQRLCQLCGRQQPTCCWPSAFASMIA